MGESGTPPPAAEEGGKEYIWSERGGWVEAPYGCLTSVGRSVPLSSLNPLSKAGEWTGEGGGGLVGKGIFCRIPPPSRSPHASHIYFARKWRGKPRSADLDKSHFFCPAAGQEGERKVCKMGNANAARRNEKWRGRQIYKFAKRQKRVFDYRSPPDHFEREFKGCETE